jgi:hypothetical protein
MDKLLSAPRDSPDSLAATPYKKGQLVIYGSSPWAEYTAEHVTAELMGRQCAKIGKIDDAVYSCAIQTDQGSMHAWKNIKQGPVNILVTDKEWGETHTATVALNAANVRTLTVPLGTTLVEQVGYLSKYRIIDSSTNDSVDVALTSVYDTNLNGILLIQALNSMNFRISVDQYNELTGVPGVRGGANKNVNKRIKNSRYKKSKKSKRR